MNDNTDKIATVAGQVVDKKLEPLTTGLAAVEDMAKRLRGAILALIAIAGIGFAASELLHRYAKDDDMKAVMHRLDVLETEVRDVRSEIRREQQP